MAQETQTLDSLDFDDTQEQTTPQQEEPTPESQPEAQQQPDNQSTDAIKDYLSTIGIKDSSKIKFEDDKGNVQEKSWDSLTEDEKLNILKTPNVKQVDPSQASAYGLDDQETQLINYLRANNLSPEEYSQMLQQQGAKSNTPEPVYQVDSLSDDDLYLADMQLRAKDITDEELQQALEQAKSNPETYQKYVNGLREEYKNLENQNSEQQQAEEQAAQQEQYTQFSNQVLNSINNLNSIGDLDISMDDREKDELAQFILGQDGAGVNYITKALNNPDTLVAASWFLLNGQNAFSEIQDYVSNAVKQARQAGREEAIKEMKGSSKPSVIVTSPNRPNQSNTPVNSIDDINFD